MYCLLDMCNRISIEKLSFFYSAKNNRRSDQIPKKLHLWEKDINFVWIRVTIVNMQRIAVLQNKWSGH